MSVCKETLMMIRNGLPLTAACMVAAWAALPSAWAQQPPPAAATGEVAKTFHVREGFQTPLTLTNKQGKSVSLKVGMHRWSIDGALGQQTVRVDEFTLFQMRSGKIKTVVDGKEVIRGADAYWTLPAGSTFTFEVKGEAALLDAMTVSTK
jgi:hypothetical protein